MKLKMNLGQKLHTIFRGKTEKQAVISEIEELLITADFGIDFTKEIRDELWKKMALSNDEDHTDLIKEVIKERMVFSGLHQRGDGLNAYLIFGVNGSGKTTTVGKLAYKLKNEGNNVLIAAADTYRDAAIDQLEYLLSIPSIISIPLLNSDPTWAPLRDHPRFQKLLRQGK